MSTRQRRQSTEDFKAEIESHLGHAADDLVRDGVAPDEARAAARRQFGNVAHAMERFYEAQRWVPLDNFLKDVRTSVRSLARYPVAALVAMLSLGAGIGATTLSLAIRQVVFHNPPPLYGEPEELSRVQYVRPTQPLRPIGNYVPGTLFASWRTALGTNAAAAAPASRPADIRAGDRTLSMPVRAVTSNLFSVVGVAPALGGGFSSPSSAVLSYRAWQTLFDGRVEAMGATVWIDDRPFTVAGVMPARFWFSEMNSPVWTLLDPAAAAGADALDVVIRRPNGESPASLSARLEPGLIDYDRRRPVAERQARIVISTVNGTPMAKQMSVVLPYLLETAVLLTLLIACANVSILIIAQWTAREQELAIRASLGASRGRLVRELLTESMLLATAGALVGVVATFALRRMVLHRVSLEAFFDLSIGVTPFVLVSIVTILVGIGCGLAPALYETGRLLGNPLLAIGAPERVRQRWRHALVVVEIALTVALTVTTGAMLDSYERAHRADLGFDVGKLMSVRIENETGVPTATLLAALRALPGVTAVAGSTTIPYTLVAAVRPVAKNATGSSATPAEAGAVTSDFFRTLGVPVRAGRGFDATDSARSRTAIVNETLAQQVLGSGNPVGQTVWIGDSAYEVVGVVADYADHPFESRDYKAKAFIPLDVNTRDRNRLPFVIRAAGDPAGLVEAVRRASRQAAPGNTVAGAFTFPEIVSIMGQEILVGTAPLVPLIVIGFLLTAAGLYGVLSFAIARRSRELAVRIAVGAARKDVVRLVAVQSTKLVSIGAAIGIVIMFGLNEIVRAEVGTGSPWDAPWLAFAAPVVLIAAVALLATYIPAKRALQTNAAELLRCG